MYEALDAGCIPVLLNQFGNPSSPSAAVQYQFLPGLERGDSLHITTSSRAIHRRGLPPFLWANAPSELREQLVELRSNPNALDALQRDTVRWWNRSLEHLRDRVISNALGLKSCRSDGRL
tara:strand:- start:196 stop:555 length:360 start_codon:yes stop_codon:yes gene_type:complete